MAVVRRRARRRAASRSGSTEVDRARARRGRLGAFLRALHDAHRCSGLPRRPDAAAPTWRVRVPKTLEAAHAPSRMRGCGMRAPPSIALLDGRARARRPSEAEPSSCTATCTSRHLLVDGAGGAAAGVIDWGDICRGDPSIDLSLLWSLLGPRRPRRLPRRLRLADRRPAPARPRAGDLPLRGPRALRPPRGMATRAEARAALTRAAEVSRVLGTSICRAGSAGGLDIVRTSARRSRRAVSRSYDRSLRWPTRITQ